MRAGFHGHREPFGACVAKLRQRQAGRKMDYVQTKAVFAAQRQHQPYGIQFRFIGPRLQVS